MLNSILFYSSAGATGPLELHGCQFCLPCRMKVGNVMGSHCLICRSWWYNVSSVHMGIWISAFKLLQEPLLVHTEKPFMECFWSLVFECLRGWCLCCEMFHEKKFRKLLCCSAQIFKFVNIQIWHIRFDVTYAKQHVLYWSWCTKTH